MNAVDDTLPEAARRVEAALAAQGMGGRIRFMPSSTRTAQEAADALGCAVAQIAKSLVFRAAASGRAALVVASGINRVDERKLQVALGEAVARADADFVRAKTGFAIGGVPPIGHLEAPLCFIDDDLLILEKIWAAAGTPRAVFPLTPAELCRITKGRISDLKQTS